jgi:hypothetical protein
MEERRDLHINSLSNTFNIENVNNIELYSLKSENSSNIESVGKQQLGCRQSQCCGQCQDHSHSHSNNRGYNMFFKFI